MTDRQKYKHIYWAWKSMKQRTLNPKCDVYKNYGGRGIDICEEWKLFEPFLEWSLSNRWKEGLDIDRIDNDKGYYPENCRWTTRKVNVNNRRKTIMVRADGVCLSISEWSEKTGIPIGSLKVWAETKGKEYVSMRIADALENGYRKNDYGNTHRMSVLHIKSGIRYESIKTASKATGVSAIKISKSLKENSDNPTWELIDEQKKELDLRAV